MPRILFIAAHRPNRSPSQRYRFEQYLNYLRQNGFEYDFSYIITAFDDKYFYSPGNILLKTFIFLKGLLKRFRDVLRAGNYDLIFIQREAFMTGSTFFEKRLKKSGAKVVFDFDDAIWHLDVSAGNKKFEWLKNPGKTADIIDHADLILAGNNYLADYAKHHNENIKIIPTTIDTDFHIPKWELRKKENCITIGWCGSHTTIKHFEAYVPVLKIIKQKYGEKIKFKVVGDPLYQNNELNIKGVAWSHHTEVDHINEFDIGIMPLPDNEWTKGKCGLKGLSYMACEVVPVMSSVGVNTEIIQHGANGFLADNNEQWVDAISKLIGSEELRQKMGKAARQTVIDKYSVLSQRDNYVKYLNELIGK